MLWYTITCGQAGSDFIITSLNKEVNALCRILTDKTVRSVVSPLVNRDCVSLQHILALRQTIDRLLQIAVTDSPRLPIALPCFDESGDVHIAILINCTLVTNVVGLLSTHIIGCPATDIAFFEVRIDQYKLSSFNWILLSGVTQILEELDTIDFIDQDNLCTFYVLNSGILIGIDSTDFTRFYTISICLIQEVIK